MTTAPLSFTKKSLRISITLGKGTFGAGLGNTKIIEGLRVECTIEKGGHPSKNKAKLKIYGMLARDINTLTTLSFKPLAIRKNLIMIEAGDSNGMSVAFKGDITGAWANYHTPPNLYFQIEALSGFYPSVASSKPKSFPGPASVAVMMGALAAEMGYSIENNGVTAKVANPYLGGTAFQQASQLADASNVEFGVDDEVLFIAPRGAPRKGLAPLLSAETGMKEYPVFDKKGISVECLYNPGIQLGGLIVVKSEVDVANGTWRVNGLTHHLSCEHPGGQWTSKIKASYVGN